MQLVNPLEQQNAVKTLYSEFVSPVCAKYGLTRIELDILLFLANNTRYDTATDIVEVRFLAKSQVSAAIKNLEARGCLRREYQLENRKTAHLRLCDPAQPMIAAGRSAQEQFGAALLDGFTPEELEHMQRSMERILRIRGYNDSARIEVIIQCLGFTKKFRTEDDIVAMIFFADRSSVANRNRRFNNNDCVRINF